MSRCSKEKVIKAATKIFAKKGFDGTSMREIAKAAHLTKPMIYYHFKNKEDLYLYILENSISTLSKKVEKITSEDREPEEIIRNVVKIYVKYFKEEENIFRIIHREIISRSRYIGILTDKYFLNIHRSISNVLYKGIEKGVFKKIDKKMATTSIIGIIAFYFARWRLIGQSSSKKLVTEKEINSLDSHIVKLLMSDQEA